MRAKDRHKMVSYFFAVPNLGCFKKNFKKNHTKCFEIKLFV